MNAARVGAAVVAGVTLGATLAGASIWTQRLGQSPDGPRFRVFCGTASPDGATPEHYAGEDPDTYRPCTCGEDSRPAPERSLLDRFVDALPGGAEGCLEVDRRDDIERWASEGFRALMSHGFASPSPRRLGPVMPDHEGRPAVRLYADTELSANYASTLAPCLAPPGRNVDLLSRISFRPGQFGNAQPGAEEPTFQDAVVFRLLTHELVHVIQNAQTFTAEPSDDCPEPLWVREAAADALSAKLTLDRFKSYRPPISEKGSRSLYGLRPYTRGLTWEDTRERDRHGNAVVPHYTSSSFWTYLSDRFSNGDFHYLARMYDAPGGGADWLAWLDRRLEAVIGHPLHVLFPDFVAHYVRWGEKRFGHVGEEIWLRESFPRDGVPCPLVRLSPGARATGEVRLSFEPISAQCVRVRVDGIPHGRRAWVHFMVHETSEERADNLHLAIARSSAIAVETRRKQDCWERALGPNSKQPCLVKQFVGRREVEGLGTNRWVKTWLSDEYESESGEIEILYVISHVPVDPTDAKHDVALPVQSSTFDIALHLTRLTTAERGPAAAPSARVNEVPDGGTVPMSGVDAGPLAMVSQALLRPGSALSGVELPEDAPIGDGIRTLTLRDSPEGGQLGAGLELRLHLLRRPITFGATGVYRAYVMGADGGPAGAGEGPAGLSDGRIPSPAQLTAGLDGMLLNVPANDEAGSASVDVVEFSDELLHMRIDGTYCRGSDLDVRSGACREPRTFQAEIVRPFGWTYDTEQEFVSVDTPSMREYRRYLPYPSAGLSAELPDRSGIPDPEPPPPEPAGGAGAADSDGVAADLVLGGSRYAVVPNLCDLPDRIPGVVLSGEAEGSDGSRGLLMVTRAVRGGESLEEQVVLSAPDGSYRATHRRTDGRWERLIPTPASDPSSPLDRGEPAWVPAAGPLLVIDGATLRASGVFYGPETGLEGWEGTLDVTCGDGQ